MKKKIVIKVQMSSDKLRTKALKLMASTQGADLISIKGEDKDQLVMVGESIDVVKLVTNLRKKVGHAEIVIVKNKGDDEEDEDPEAEIENRNVKYVTRWYPNYYPYY